VLAAGEDVEAEVAAACGPFVVLFGEDGADEADEGVAVGENADDVALPNAPPAQKPRCPEDRRKPKRTAMFYLVAVSDGSQKATSSQMDGPGDPSQAWPELAPDYERARSREDSLDRLVEWPAQRDLLGDVNGRSVLDVGCGNGGKLAELVGDGATASVGVDVSGNFLSAPPPGLELIRGDLNELDSMPELAGRTFDRILFLQSFGYAKDPVRTLQTARVMLADDGFILLTKTQPIRYAVERAEQNETSLGEEYFSTARFSYLSGWNDQITLTKRPYTISDLINVFSAAGLWIETAIEPQLSEDARRRYPHKQAWMNKYLGILIFKLRPHSGQ
jgi:SAM-dependent methyltransferase